MESATTQPQGYDGPVHTYTNDELTVSWRPGLCIHSKRCWHGLPAVFQPQQRPWINVEGATSPVIAAQIGQCPSGALSYRWKESDAVKTAG